MILHDFTDSQIRDELQALSQDQLVLAAENYQNCMGCFNCWVNNPGVCVIKDSFSDIAKKLIASDHIYVISRCCYGGLSPQIKSVLDRAIPNSLPAFYTKNGRMYHKQRYNKRVPISFIIYGDMTKEEKILAQKIAKALCDNFHFDITHSAFCSEANVLTKLDELLKEFEGKE